MANKKASKKDIITSIRNRNRNMAVKSRMKTFVKKAEQALTTGGDAAQEALRVAVSEIDRAASKGIIHARTAARKKSNLARRAAAPAAK